MPAALSLDSVRLAVAVDLVALTLLVSYHLYLARVYRREPDRTYRGHSNRLRRAWVSTMRTRGSDILAVQTMRNWVMSASLFASTSMLIGLGVGHVAFTGTDLGDLATHLGWFPPPGEALIRVKLLALAAIFFAAFHDFALSLRYYNHVGFLINLPDQEVPGLPLESVAATLNRAGGHYNRGTRKFLLATPFALWLIGPPWFLAGSLLGVWVLYRYDFRHPDATGDGSGD